MLGTTGLPFHFEIAAIVPPAMMRVTGASNRCMKQKLIIALVALSLGIALGWSFARWRATQPKPNVAIQDGKTIDFSSGKPVVKDDPAEKKIIADAVAEMDAASKDVSFAPPPASAEKKSTQPDPKQSP